MIIDIHTHILPQIDDGSDSVETSLAILQRMAQQRVKVVCATSHYYAEENSIASFCARRAHGYEKLRQGGLKKRPIVRLAAEVAFFDGISEARDLDRLCIQDTRTLMLEMPFCDWYDFQIDEVKALVFDLRYQVVLVHPERFCGSKVNRAWLKQLAELPLCLQVNTGSLVGWHTRKLALELLQATATPLLGSDCHNLSTRPPNLEEGRSIVRRKLGLDFLKSIDRNSKRLVTPCFAAP